MNDDLEDYAALRDAALDTGGRPAAPTGRRRKDALPPELEGMFGNANLYFAEGKYLEAIKLLQEIVRHAPEVSEAYRTLGLIYMSIGNERKALDFYQVAAVLSPSDTALWKRLAEMHRQQGSLKDAIECYTKVLRHTPNDLNAIWDRCVLFEQAGEKKRAMDGYNSLLRHRPRDLQVVRSLVRLMVENRSDLKKASDMYEQAFEDPVGQPIEYLDVHYLAELYLLQKRWQNIIQLIRTWIPRLQQSETTAILPATITNYSTIPIDITIKLGVAELHTGNDKEAEASFQVLSKHSVEENHDLYYSVANAYFETEHYEQALSIYRNLVDNPIYNNENVWMNMAKCSVELGEAWTAIELYEAVLKYSADTNVDTAIFVHKQLEKLYQQLGNAERSKEHSEKVSRLQQSKLLSGTTSKEAAGELEGLEAGSSSASVASTSKRRSRPSGASSSAAKGSSSSTSGTSIASRGQKRTASQLSADDSFPSTLEEQSSSIQQTKFFNLMQNLKRENIGEFIKEASVFIDQFGQNRSLFSDRISKNIKSDKIIPPVIKKRKEDTITMPTAQTVIMGLRQSQWLQLFFAYFEQLAKNGSFTKLLTTINHISRSNMISANHNYCSSLYAIAIGACIQTQDVLLINGYLRWFCNNNAVENAKNMFNFYTLGFTLLSGPQSISEFTSSVNVKYLHRLTKASDNPSLLIVAGHQMALTRSFGLAIAYYLRALRQVPDQPLIYLCLGVVCIQWAMSRRCPNRHLQIAQSLAFVFQYLQLTGKTCESLYNLARTFHQIGLYYFAVELYQQVLQFDAAEASDDKEESLIMLFHRLAAYNLSQIFANVSGSVGLAEHILIKYFHLKYRRPVSTAAAETETVGEYTVMDEDDYNRDLSETSFVSFAVAVSSSSQTAIAYDQEETNNHTQPEEPEEEPRNPNFDHGILL